MMIKARMDFETRREESREALELMTTKILLLDKPWQVPFGTKLGRMEHLGETTVSKLMPHSAVCSRISRFPQTMCQKMETTIDWILMSQPNIPVRLVPKSKPKFPAMIIQWENPLFWYLVLLSVLLTLYFFFLWGKICAVSKCYNFGCKFPYYRWHLSGSVWLGFDYDRDPFTFSLLLNSPRAWLALASPGGTSALQPLTCLTQEHLLLTLLGALEVVEEGSWKNENPALMWALCMASTRTDYTHYLFQAPDDCKMLTIFPFFRWET